MQNRSDFSKYLFFSKIRMKHARLIR